MTREQGLFQLERRVATAEAVIVLVDEATRKSGSLPAAVVKRLVSLMKERTSQGVNAGDQLQHLERSEQSDAPADHRRVGNNGVSSAMSSGLESQRETFNQG
jgi:hypothetical protein